jgi:hypothetical protein
VSTATIQLATLENDIAKLRVTAYTAIRINMKKTYIGFICAFALLMSFNVNAAATAEEASHYATKLWTSQGLLDAL